MPATTALPLSGWSRVVRTAYGGGLARAVRPEQAQDGAFGDVEVDAVQSPYVAEGLHQTFGVDGAWHMRYSHGLGDSGE